MTQAELGASDAHLPVAAGDRALEAEPAEGELLDDVPRPDDADPAEDLEPDQGSDEAEDTPAQEEPAADAADLARLRFVEMVEERVKRLRYSHALTRHVYTTEEKLIRSVVDRRASVWVPTFTFVATVGSAVAAVVLASRLRSDPVEDYGTQFYIVLGAVVLLAASFIALFRSEIYFDRLRPHGRLVRADVADAYDVIQDAPRVFVELGASQDVLERVAEFGPTSERLIDALVEYAGVGGTLMRAHPAYDRVIRMRAEIEVLALMLEDAGATDPSAPRRRVGGSDAALPRPDQVADYESLGDIAVFIEQP